MAVIILLPKSHELLLELLEPELLELCTQPYMCIDPSN